MAVLNSKELLELILTSLLLTLQLPMVLKPLEANSLSTRLKANSSREEATIRLACDLLRATIWGTSLKDHQEVFLKKAMSVTGAS